MFNIGNRDLPTEICKKYLQNIIGLIQVSGSICFCLFLAERQKADDWKHIINHKNLWF